MLKLPMEKILKFPSLIANWFSTSFSEQGMQQLSGDRTFTNDGNLRVLREDGYWTGRRRVH
jgi:hypothetical protein